MTGPRAAVAAVAAVLGLLAPGCAGDRGSTGAGMPPAPPESTTPTVSVTSVDDTPMTSVDITVVGVVGYDGGEVAGIVAQESDGLIVGGFLATVDRDPFTTTQRLLRPAGPRSTEGRSEPWPPLTAETAELSPGDYVLSLWVDHGLSGYASWVPMNSDGLGLEGCVQRFTVGHEQVTEIVVGGDVRSTGTSGVCISTLAVGEPGGGPFAGEIVDGARVDAAPPFAAEFEAARSGVVAHLLVWRDEFLAVGRAEPHRQLPSELPADIATQFPHEVQELFPEGLPETLEEAVAVIEEAGLMNEVSDAVESIPGAVESIFPEHTEAWSFARSPDGAVWEPLDVVLPDDMVQIFDVAAWEDHLVVVGRDRHAGPLAASNDAVVAWTDDLRSWTTARLGARRPVDLPADAILDTWDGSVVANGLGWMVTVFVGLQLGDEALPIDPSPELDAYLHDGEWGPAPLPARWFSSWSGEPALTVPVEPDIAAVDDGVTVATDAGFVHVADAVRFSGDGTSWRTQVMLDSEIDRTTDVGGWHRRTMSSQPTSNGFVLISDTRATPVTVWLMDAVGEPLFPIEVPGLPPDIDASPGGSGYVFNSGVHFDDGFEPWIVATPDGRRWYVEQLDAPEPDEYARTVAVLNGDTLLFGSDSSDDSWTIVMM